MRSNISVVSFHKRVINKNYLMELNTLFNFAQINIYNPKDVQLIKQCGTITE